MAEIFLEIAFRCLEITSATLALIFKVDIDAQIF